MRQETRNPAPTAGKSLVFGEGDMFEELAKSGTLSGMALTFLLMLIEEIRLVTILQHYM